ncbi:flagellar protein G [Halodesulfurarchaeum formicicum]|uniref:Flagella-related protein G n=1 Tax=Halodesulfurarchaeum formicicum TaxID=1873524 RepID=A0A1J1ACJ7_9EURY|nr:flagellar protein G [Halodesulfurarchaeum formicicum]APE95870.1 flagella-related protein G [Halodesulfurarchaeum formicicum]
MAIVSSETLILFIAAVLVAGSVAGAMTGGVSQLSEALEDRSLDVSQEIRTDIEVISDPGSGQIYDDGTNTVTLLLKNTGSNTLSTDPTTVDTVIDGQYRTDQSIEILDATQWGPGSVARLTVSNVTLGTDTDHRVVLNVNGNRERFDFRT